jgi:hypothetical protein
MTSLRCRPRRDLARSRQQVIVPRARGATGNAVKSNAWDENEVLLEGEEWRRPDTAVREAPAIGRMGTRRGVMSFYGAEFPSE